MRVLFVFLVALAIVGCATDPASIAALADAQARINAQPTMTIKCASGCEANYTDPRDRGQIALPTNGWDALKSTVQTGAAVITGVAPWAAVGAVAVRGMKSAGGNDNSVTSNQIGPESQNTTTTTTQTDNSSVDSHDATATPTVVNQPAPVVVHPVVVGP